MRASVACALLLAPCCMRDAYDLARDLCMRCLHGGFCGAACCWFVVARAVRLPCKLACLVRKRLQAGCKRLQTHTAGGGSMQARSQAWPWRMIWRMRVPESLQPCGHAPRVMHPCPGCLAACLPPNQLCSHALAPRQPRMRRLARLARQAMAFWAQPEAKRLARALLFVELLALHTRSALLSHTFFCASIGTLAGSFA